MIPKIERILYATDLSKNSAYAFYYAVDIAQKRDAKILILHSLVPIHPSLAVFMDEKVYSMQKNNIEEAKHEISRRLRDICANVDAKMGGQCADFVDKIIVREGYPVEEILKAVDEEKCDVIILGNHGKGFLQQTFLGSVSRAVLDRSRKPVFVIPLPSEDVDINWG
jgi:nucleotide-binding universal stress UspA family protein